MWNNANNNAHTPPGNNNQWSNPPNPFNFPTPGGFPAPSFGPPPSPYNGGAAPTGPGFPTFNQYTPPSGPPPGQSPYTPSYGPPYGQTYQPPPGPPPQAGSFPGQPDTQARTGYPGQAFQQNYNHASPPLPGNPWTPSQGYQSPPAMPSRAPSQGYTPPISGTPHMPPTQVQHYGPQFQGSNGQPQRFDFQYSACNGRKKALCIGINYIGTSGELRGCINDARNVSQFLCQQYGYQEKDIVILTDDARNPVQQPRKDNILRAMQWLVKDARPNDSLFFHFSGHGGQTKDKDGDEADGYDEVIYPADFESAGHIVDDMMHDIMVKPLPAGCRLTAIFDSCHSGSSLDLPFIYSTEGKIKEPNLAAEAGKGAFGAVTAYARGDIGGAIKGVGGLLKMATGNPARANEHAKKTRTSPADVISWSGCKDSQTSADTVEGGEATGAMSYAFMESIRANPQQTYQELLQSVRKILRSKYSQKPQLSSSHPMDTSIIFIC